LSSIDAIGKQIAEIDAKVSELLYLGSRQEYLSARIAAVKGEIKADIKAKADLNAKLMSKESN